MTPSIHRPSARGLRGPDLPPVLSETAWRDRRRVLKLLGLGGGLLAAGPAAAWAGDRCDPGQATYPASERWVPAWPPAGGKELYPATRNPTWKQADRALTPEDAAAQKNNFYEFLPGRAGPVHRYVGDFEPDPWKVEIAGLVEEERAVDVDEIARIAPLEERVYRFRCVERWSMVVPWTGLPMAAFVKWCRPTSEARYVKFTSFLRPEQAPGQRRGGSYPWPYYEGLRLDEATHPLTLLVTGIFGHGLPAQHGAPVRVVVPWKYGYKSAKSFVRVEFTRDEPGTFWSDLQPLEYPFLSNVEPDVPHPRWSQATETDIGTGDRFPTRPYNGYADEVAKLYAG